MEPQVYDMKSPTPVKGGHSVSSIGRFSSRRLILFMIVFLAIGGIVIWRSFASSLVPTAADEIVLSLDKPHVEQQLDLNKGINYNPPAAVLYGDGRLLCADDSVQTPFKLKTTKLSSVAMNNLVGKITAAKFTDLNATYTGDGYSVPDLSTTITFNLVAGAKTVAYFSGPKPDAFTQTEQAINEACSGQGAEYQPDEVDVAVGPSKDQAPTKSSSKTWDKQTVALPRAKDDKRVVKRYSKQEAKAITKQLGKSSSAAFIQDSTALAVSVSPVLPPAKPLHVPKNVAKQLTNAKLPANNSEMVPQKTISDGQRPAVITMSVSPNPTSLNGHPVLTWEATNNPAWCTGSGQDFTGAKSITGSQQLNGPFNADRTYTLQCGGEGGISTASVTLRTTSKALAATTATLSWSYAGPIAGKTCTQINEPGDPYFWGDNYLCASANLGLRWSYAGRIAGMNCTLFSEPSDPHFWGDNYLCAPSNTSYGLQFGYAGRVSGKTCVSVNEPGDPYYWNDNYICSSSLSINTSSTVPTSSAAKWYPGWGFWYQSPDGNVNNATLVATPTSPDKLATPPTNGSWYTGWGFWYQSPNGNVNNATYTTTTKPSGAVAAPTSTQAPTQSTGNHTVRYIWLYASDQAPQVGDINRIYNSAQYWYLTRVGKAPHLASTQVVQGGQPVSWYQTCHRAGGCALDPSGGPIGIGNGAIRYAILDNVYKQFYQAGVSTTVLVQFTDGTDPYSVCSGGLATGVSTTPAGVQSGSGAVAIVTNANSPSGGCGDIVTIAAAHEQAHTMGLPHTTGLDLMNASLLYYLGIYNLGPVQLDPNQAVQLNQLSPYFN